jgi:hypothetical protein
MVEEVMLCITSSYYFPHRKREIDIWQETTIYSRDYRIVILE